MATIQIPTSRRGIILSSVTDHEHRGWLLINRNFGHPLQPDQRGAPDYFAFQDLRKQWSKTEPDQLNMGIWDERRPRTPLFAGYVTLKPYNLINQRAAEVGCEIARKLHRHGYASLAISAIMKYGREELGYETVVADILSKNEASCRMVENLGFKLSPELSREKMGHSIYLHQEPAAHQAA